MNSSIYAGLSNSGDGGIRTHVPGLTDNSISSRARYDRFDTSPSLLLLSKNISVRRVRKHKTHYMPGEQLNARLF